MATHLPAAASLSALIMAAALGQTVIHDPVVMPAVHKLSDWLRERTSEIIEGCTLLASDGTTIFTPDATHSYGAQWSDVHLPLPYLVCPHQLGRCFVRHF